MRCRSAVPLLALLALGWAACTGLAGDAPKARRGWRDPLRYSDMVKQALAGASKSEAGEMVSAILKGSQMGPGEGWFHGSESRYSWEWLAAFHGVGKYGRITPKQFKGTLALFQRLDRNHDGLLTAHDFDWSSRSPHMTGSRMASYWFSRIDGDANGRITRAEWGAFFEKAAGEKGYLTQDDLQNALGMIAPSQQPRPANAPSGPSTMVLLTGLLKGELGSLFEGPKVGAPAPDFALKTQDTGKLIRLSDFRGKKPVVIVFGSFT
jgi:hypothetical protein